MLHKERAHKAWIVIELVNGVRVRTRRAVVRLHSAGNKRSERIFDLGGLCLKSSQQTS